MKSLLSGSLLSLIAVTALLYPIQPKAHNESPAFPGLSNESLQQETEKEPPDSFDDEAIQPQPVYKSERDFLREALTSKPALDHAVLELIQSPETLAVREVPLKSNTGPEVNKYLEYCNVTPPAWWCAAFVSYEIKQASKKPNVPKSQWPKFALCDDIFNWATKHNLIVNVGTEGVPIPSVMLIRNKDSSAAKKYVHTGFVVGYDSATGKLDTIEGNSNTDGSNNGIGVFRLKRTKRASMVFVRIV